MFPFNYLEYFLGRLLSSNRGRDAELWINDKSLFRDDIPQNLTVTCPDIGPSNSVMPLEYSAYGTSKFPTLSWTVDTPSTSTATSTSDSTKSQIKEYIVLVEDPDAPLPLVPNHGLFYAIPATKTTITADDIVLDTKTNTTGTKHLRGGFRLGKNLRGSIYAGPRPPLGHGPHRYFYQVVALNQALDVDNGKKMKPVATKAELEVAIKGKIVGYGVWIGVFERKWE